MTSIEKEPHSCGILTDLRDFWWNPDFIELMAFRWKLESIQSVLDVGCGIGHWGHMLSAYLPKSAMLVGIDPETTYVLDAAKRAQNKGIAIQTQYCLGSAENIPYPDNHFDMVTCQTVLIHVKDVAIAIKEMLRVLKPGGLLAVVEPNNSASCLVFNTLNFEDTIEEKLNYIRYRLICDKGKAALHEGHSSYGDIIPHYFYQANLSNIQVYLNDLADYFVPSYNTAREQAILHTAEIPSQESWEQEKQRAKRYFLAGQGAEEEFEQLFETVIKRTEAKIRSYQNKTICTAGGEMMYLISGYKPFNL